MHRSERIPTLQIDHISPGSAEVPPQAVLYLDTASASAVPLLEYLERHAQEYPSFRYIVRYKPSSASSGKLGSGRDVPLSGYGVELALKKTDYLVVDDRAAPVQKSEGANGAVTKNVEAGPFDAELGADPWSELSTPLRPTEIAGESYPIRSWCSARWLIRADVHVKAAAFIASSSNPLEALQHISQDFPKYSAALARKVIITDAVQDKIRSMERRGQADATIYVNGKSVMAEEITAFS